MGFTHRAACRAFGGGRGRGDQPSVLGSRAVQQWVEVFCVCSFTVIVLIRLKFTLQTQSASNTLQKHKSSSSFTPFIDPRLLQISPSSGTTVTSVGKYAAASKQPPAGYFSLCLVWWACVVVVGRLRPQTRCTPRWHCLL